MARPRRRCYLLATGAGLAAARSSVSDFTGVIHSYYSDNSTTSAPTPVPPPASIGRPAPPPLAGLSSAGRLAKPNQPRQRQAAVKVTPELIWLAFLAWRANDVAMHVTDAASTGPDGPGPGR